MNRTQRSVVAGRDRGYQRVAQLTRWTAGGGGLALAVIGVVLAQGPASASTATTPGAVATPSLPQAPAPDSSSQGLTSQGYDQSGSQGLQSPVAPPQYSPPQYSPPQYSSPQYSSPQYSYGSGSGVLSGGS